MLKYFLPAIILFAIALVFGVLISFLSKKLAVPKDEKEEKTLELLAGANCGACGYAGCAAFAKALAEGKASLSACNATSKDNKAMIAEILGAGDVGEESIVVVACRGGLNCKDKHVYVGYDNCKYNAAVASGCKQCPTGCLGYGTCNDVCPEGAITVGKDEGYASIDRNKCIACGMCVDNCPQRVIKKIPASAKVYVACSSTEKGKSVKEKCSVGCIGCGLCAKTCESGAITMANNLPVIDYAKCTGCMKCVDKCPCHSIVPIV